MTPEAFVDQLCAEVPEAGALIDAHLDDYDELLLHVLVADLRRVLTQAFQDGDVDLVRRGLDVCERALLTGEAEVVNAVAVSFVEGAGWHDPATQAFIDAWPTALRAEMARQRSWETPGSDDAGEPDPYYVFIWDRETDRLVASFAVAKPGARKTDVPDVSGGIIPAEREAQWLDDLTEQYPGERYTFGGGYAPTLEACVQGFFGLDKDHDER